MSIFSFIARHRLRRWQHGGSMLEFTFAAPVMLIVGLGTVQMGLVYHANSIMNYATFEAARAGSVAHADVEVMKKEFGFRIAPLFGGDGTPVKAARAVITARATVQDPLRFRLRIINPTVAAFDDWGVPSEDRSVREIPNQHLRHKDRANIGAASGLNLHDANLLKIEITYGVPLKIPYISDLLAEGMISLDPGHAAYYTRRLWPMKSVATVRMQNEVRETAAFVSATRPPAREGDDSEGQGGDPAAGDEPNESDDGQDDTGEDTDQENSAGQSEPDAQTPLTQSPNSWSPGQDACHDEYGLPLGVELASTPASVQGQCVVDRPIPPAASQGAASGGGAC